MINVLEEDIVFNELQDPCKGQSPCVCPVVVQPVPTNCPNCNLLNQADGCKWSCVKIPGIGWRANFVSGCSGTFCTAPDDDFKCANCPTPDTACKVVDGSAEAGKDYGQCKGSCDANVPVCNGVGTPETACNYEAKAV